MYFNTKFINIPSAIDMKNKNIRLDVDDFDEDDLLTDFELLRVSLTASLDVINSLLLYLCSDDDDDDDDDDNNNDFDVGDSLSISLLQILHFFSGLVCNNSN